MFPDKVPHFFRILLEDNTRNEKLGFPKKFVQKYGKCLPEMVVLNVPGGEGWRVELTNCNGEIWLQKGWQEFVEFYSLAEGHFLLFKYEGNFHFCVLIFDKSATEIDYPCTEKSFTHEESQDPYKEQIHGFDFTSSHKIGETSSPPCRKMKTIDSDIKATTGLRLQDTLETDSGSQCRKVMLVNSNSKLKSGNSVGKPKGNFEQIPSDKNAGKQAARGSIPSGIPRAHGAKSKFNNYPSFTAIIRLYHFRHHTMQIPRGFLEPRSHYHGQIVMLKVAKRSWPVKLLVYESGHSSCFSSGWAKFVRENCLQVRDVCTFEMVKREVIKVSISRKGR